MTDRVLVIMRHGKAEQSPLKNDVDRALTDRGRADARAAGVWLADANIMPTAVLCSPAIRTRGTWHAVAIGLADTLAEVTSAPTVIYSAELYENGVAAVLDLIRGTDEDVTTLLVIGHNPTVSALSHRLDDSRMRAAGGLRTSGLAVHRVTTSWPELGAASLIEEHTPRA
jgi:phosphohistidine phosphatase